MNQSFYIVSIYGIKGWPKAREEMLMVVSTETAHTVVVGTTILFVFVLAYLIPTTS